MSLNLRLILLIAPVFIGLWCIASYFSMSSLNRDISEAMDQRLASTASMVDNLLQSMPARMLDDSLNGSKIVNDVGTQKGLACKISSLSGQVIANSHPDALGISDSLPLGFSDVEQAGLAWRVFTLKTDFHTITIAEKFSERASIYSQVILTNAIPTALAIFFSLLFIWLAVRQAMLPLSQLSQSLATRNENDLRPVECDSNLQELRPVVDSQNALLARLKEAIEREKAFTGNAAHELKTPLTGIISQLQVASATQGETQQHALRQTAVSAKRLSSLLDNLLLLARVESGSATFEVQSWDAEKETSAALESLKVKEQVSTYIESAQSINRIPAFAAQTIVKNLIDNAIRYGDEPNLISLNIQADTTGLKIEVINSGQVSEQHLALMDQRFWRGSAQPGAGLGLAIVKALTEQFNGELLMRNLDDGRFSVCVRF